MGYCIISRMCERKPEFTDFCIFVRKFFIARPPSLLVTINTRFRGPVVVRKLYTYLVKKYWFIGFSEKLMMRKRENPHHRAWAPRVMWRCVAHTILNDFRFICKPCSVQFSCKFGKRDITYSACVNTAWIPAASLTPASWRVLWPT